MRFDYNLGMKGGRENRKLCRLFTNIYLTQEVIYVLHRNSQNNLAILSMALIISMITSACSSNSSKLSATTTTSKCGLKPNVCEIKQNPTKNTCNVRGYVIDKDPQGLNVRSGAGTKYKIIGKLPTINEIAPFEVKIAASKGNWVMITEAIDPRNVKKIAFQGRGWVYAPLLGTSPRAYGYPVSIYAQPNRNSQKLAVIPANMTATVKLDSCYGDWVKIEYKNIKGWLAPEDQCPTQITTCS